MRPHRLPTVLMGLTLSLALFPVTGASGATAPPPGRAAGGDCHGERCDGRDPIATRCTYGAYIPRIANATVPAYGGTIELHYGPGRLVNGKRTCEVNWARFVKRGQGDSYRVWVERDPAFTGKAGQDKTRTRYSGGDEGTGIIYSDQVYVGTAVPARACVERVLPVRPLGGAGVGRSAVCTAFI
ncbi:DUF2690 domain-containing protein [Nonomuraea sp. NPDC049714]|uniref:DUF2690 domain-containing protein n=1 Tax=Nonomuraea sp. NPDC049714 TaxID=3364357 RepID=UPI0037B98563